MYRKFGEEFMGRKCLSTVTLTMGLVSACLAGCGSEKSGNNRTQQTDRVTIAGIPQVGEILIANIADLEWNSPPDQWTHSGSTPFKTDYISYQWMKGDSPDGDFSNIPYATGSTYIPVEVDVDKYLKVKVNRTDHVEAVISKTVVKIENATPITSSPMYTAPDFWYGRAGDSVTSPRTIELLYQTNKANNQKMYTTFTYSPPTKQMPYFPIYESTDMGKSWAFVGKVEDTNNEWGMNNCPQLYELPATIGDFPAGTILCAGISSPSDKEIQDGPNGYLNRTRLDLYKSSDLGRTWQFVSTIAEGGKNITEQRNEWGGPIWEPFLMYVEGKLICYYSDENDSEHSQKICHKTTVDLTNWGPETDDIALEDYKTRPGMAVVTKMDNGKYIMVFEIVNSGTTCWYKISNDPEGWNPPDRGTMFQEGSGGPYIITLNDGRLAYNHTGSGNIYINTKKDASGEWQPVSTPVPEGYNRCFLQLSNGRVFIVSTIGFWVTNQKKTVRYGETTF
jgi:hypothetical protein